MTTQKKRAGRARRDEILEVALELFGEQGYSGTTTRQITDRLGIVPAALYYHFKNKMACLHALVEPYFVAIEDLITRFPSPVSDDVQARRFLTEYQTALLADPRVSRLVDRDVAIARDPFLGPRLRAITDRLLELVAGPRPDTLALVRASSTLGAVRRPALRFGNLDDRAAGAAIQAAVAARNSHKPQ